MATLAIILAIAAAGLVVATLVAGLVVMVKGPEASRKHANNLMRYRVFFQMLAVIMLLIAGAMFKAAQGQ